MGKVYCLRCKKKIKTFFKVVNLSNPEAEKRLFFCECGYSAIIYYENNQNHLFCYQGLEGVEFNPSHRFDGINAKTLETYGYKMME